MSRLLDALKQLQQEADSATQHEPPREENPSHPPAATAMVTAVAPSEEAPLVADLSDADRLHQLTVETEGHLETIRQFQALRESLDRAEAQNHDQAQRLAKLESILSNQSASHSDQLDNIQEEIRRREQSHREFQSALRQEFEKLHAELTQRPSEPTPPVEAVAESSPLPPDLIDLLRELVRTGNPAPPPAQIERPTEPVAQETTAATQLPFTEAESTSLADLEHPAHRHTFGELASRIKDDLAEHDPEAAGAILLSGIGQPEIVAQAALRLALLWQQRGEEVLLIDGNCRGKSLSHLLGIDRRPGLLEVAQRQIDWPQTLHRLHQVPVHVLPAGSGNWTLTASSAHRRRLAELVEDLSRWWSLILIVAEDYDADSTPLYGSVVSAGYLEVGLGRTTDEQLSAAMRAYELHVMGHLGIIVSNASID
ncbi:MAG: hypothetical protein WD045_03310 [Pirellulaceae bacterium]